MSPCEQDRACREWS